jgi:F420-non-reducing hydrogenase iron-sulfur subunit
MLQGGRLESIPDSARVTAFVCANCARPGKVLTSARRARPAIPDFNWPGSVQQIIVPCAGRLQPEHILKAFESGSSVVSVVVCHEENCHYIEGSKRCARRIDHIRSILKEIGLGEKRLLLSQLPGSACEDLALAAGKPVPANSSGSLDAQIAALRDRMVQALRDLPPNPLLQFPPARLNGDTPQQEWILGEDDGDE